MKRGTPDHPKTLALMEELGVSKPTAVGLLELLWHFTAKFAPRGDVGRFSNRAISSAVGWDGDPNELISALVRCRWLDEHPDYRLIVHDWSEHADSSVRMWLARRGLDFVDGSAACRKPSRAQAGPVDGQHGRGQANCVVTECDLKSQQSDTADTKNLQLKSQHNSTTSATSDCTNLHHKCASPEAGSQKPEARSQSQKPEPEPEPEPGTERLGSAVSANQHESGEPPRPVQNGKAAGSALDVENHNNGSRLSRHLDWISAVEQEISAAVGRKPRPDSAVKLARQAASMGIHPRYVLGWIRHRSRASPPRSDGLFLKAIEDLPDWVRRNHAYDSSWNLREVVACPRCGEPIYAFRDVIVPCGCDTHRSRAPTMRQAEGDEIGEVAGYDATQEQI